MIWVLSRPLSVRITHTHTPGSHFQLPRYRNTLSRPQHLSHLDEPQGDLDCPPCWRASSRRCGSSELKPAYEYSGRRFFLLIPAWALADSTYRVFCQVPDKVLRKIHHPFEPGIVQKVYLHVVRYPCAARALRIAEKGSFGEWR